MSTLNLTIPVSTEKPIVPTKHMQHAADRLLALHGGHPIVVWSGLAGSGKTTTAKVILDDLAELPLTTPGRFQGKLVEACTIAGWSGNEEKRIIRTLFHGCLFKMPEGDYKAIPADSLAVKLVMGLRDFGVQLIFLDEAGRLSVEALIGVALVRNTAERLNWPLSIVLIGMGDLPTKVRGEPQLARRITDWTFFDVYKVQETQALLAALLPHFADDSLLPGELDRQVRFIHETTGGLPGFILPLVEKIDYWARVKNREITLEFIQAVNGWAEENRARAEEAQSRKYASSPSGSDEEAE